MEERLIEILREVRNLSFLFFAYGVIWTLLFLYLWTISRRNRDLKREVDELKKLRPAESDDQDQE
ncbi:MAG: CcmD family protein [Anaerolineae bacterium]|nr:CcmD family protein [Anaerolineae bacterium]